jgi:Omp85 superfamily domain
MLSEFRTSPALRSAHTAAIAVILLACRALCGQAAPTGCDSSKHEPTTNDCAKVIGSSHARESAPSSGTSVPEKTGKRGGNFVIAPLPISSPAVGSGIIPVVAYIFPLNSHDKVSPPSAVGAAGLITDNGSRAFAAAGQLFIRRDTYRLTSIFVQGNLNYNLYGIGAVAGHAGFKLPLKQDGSVFLGEILRRVKWKFFVGPRILTGHSSITLRPGGSITVPTPPDVGLHTQLTSVGFSIKRDTRPNRFYPVSGTVLEFTSDFFANGFGSKYSFQSYRVTFNKYWTVSKSQILAYNAFFCGTGGQPPFYGNCIYGTNNELRGYEAGRYLDTYMIATQLEYRLHLPKRFGLVAFGGIGGVAHGSAEFLRSNNFLPAGGAGLRFMLNKAYHVNLRADVAGGRGEHTFSMGVSEAF